MRSLFLRAALVIALGACAAPLAAAGGIRQVNTPSQTSLGDAWITTQIQAKYFLDADIKARTIDVSTLNGVVTLSGAVDSDAERRRAGQIAAAVDGARRVVNNLTVAGEQPPEGTAGKTEAPPTAVPGGDEIERVTHSDPVILSQIKAKFAVDPKVSALGIDVDVDEGVVTLKGDVDDVTTRQRAEMLAREVPGVVRVNNELKIKR